MWDIRLETSTGSTNNIFSIYLPSQGSRERNDACLNDPSDFIRLCEYGSLSIVCRNANADMGQIASPRGLNPPGMVDVSVYYDSAPLMSISVELT